eukprot:CAMPEP_0180296500 /NCGR_PEP_ID=MMETSP0988-20121125/19665_1 /TAXON_ID=697907 /ORGANISM="non described non described, Strain CCMP2293" /LENGTH=58 /DNA_ID=CAMNT_0022274349 /DNA_START=147 /DNA_END=319 /DNA_ORIENTATION=+
MSPRPLKTIMSPRPLNPLMSPRPLKRRHPRGRVLKKSEGTPSWPDWVQGYLAHKKPPP